MGGQTQSRGFSLVELVFAIGALAVAFLMIVALFLSLFKSSQKSLDLTTGTLVAESAMAQYLYGLQEQPGGLADNLKDNTANPFRGSSRLNQTEYYYEILCNDLGTADLKKVSVRVWWWEENPDRKENPRQGYGKLSVEISRIVYTDSKMEIIKQ